MDKFGIFELLDTLAALTSAQSDEQTASPETQNAPQKPSASDGAFAPPDRTSTQNTTVPAQNALEALYERHEKISKRIDDKK